MMTSNILLLFSDDYPCWDAETVRLSGENPGSLAVLEASGKILRLGNGYIITQAGIQERENLSRENFVPVSKITRIINDADTANNQLEINRMTQLLDRAFMTQWGIKEFTVNETFPLSPMLNDDEYFAVNGRVKALWPENDYLRSFMAEFPDKGWEARKLPAPGQPALDSWVRKNHVPCGNFTVDFVLRHHHDFEHYRQMPAPEEDIFRFVNASLIFAHKVREKPQELLPLIGKIHILFTLQRRIYIPGWFDMDSEEQEPMKLLTLVTDTDTELDALTQTLRSYGKDLVDLARPMYIIGTSVEHLRTQEVKPMFYDWFAEETVKILRPDIQDYD
ncbi:MAG: hypothetical protein IKQ95_04055 [Synergistaceae bacterium]|nr:hypothetical protein [Synergistaceae bacterium]